MAVFGVGEGGVIFGGGGEDVAAQGCVAGCGVAEKVGEVREVGHFSLWFEG